MINNDLINRINELMNHLGLTDSSFSKKISIHKSNFSKMLNGQRTIGDAVINKIVLAIGCNKSWLKEGNGSMFSYTHLKNNEDSVRSRIVNYMHENEIYPDKFCDEINYDLEGLDDMLTGKTECKISLIEQLKLYSPALDLNWIITGHKFEINHNLVASEIENYKKNESTENTFISEIQKENEQQRVDIEWYKKELDKKQELIDILLSGSVSVQKNAI